LTEQQFRLQLQIITTGRNADEWPAMIEALRAEYPHTIREVAAGDRRFNCFAFALGLWRSANYFRVAAGSEEPNVFADTPFVHHLVDSGFLVTAECRSAPDQLVIYSRLRNITHAGTLSAGRVTSKWGTGKYFEHAIREVPANYGDEVCCFELPLLPAVEAEFLNYAAAQGVRVDDFVGEWPGDSV
jgi:hypothetical protein